MACWCGWTRSSDKLDDFASLLRSRRSRHDHEAIQYHGINGGAGRHACNTHSSRGGCIGLRSGRRVTRTAPLPFSPPAIGEDEIAAVVDVMRSGWITTGERAKAFERQFACEL